MADVDAQKIINSLTQKIAGLVLQVTIMETRLQEMEEELNQFRDGQEIKNVRGQSGGMGNNK